MGKTDEAVTTDAAAPTEATTATQATTTEPNEPGKADAPLTMTQAELDTLVEGRLARAKTSEAATLKEKYGDLDALTAKAKAHDALKESELSDLQKTQRDLEAAQGQVTAFAPQTERLEKYEAYIKTHIVARTEGLDDATKALLGKLSDPLEVLAHLDEFADVLGKTDVHKPKPAPTHAGAGLKSTDGKSEMTLNIRPRV